MFAVTKGDTMTITHSIEWAAALHLCGTEEGMPRAGEAVLVAVSRPSDWLCVRHTRKGYVLSAGQTPADAWAEVFGVLPLGPGRVALAEAEGSAWEAAHARAMETLLVTRSRRKAPRAAGGARPSAPGRQAGSADGQVVPTDEQPHEDR